MDGRHPRRRLAGGKPDFTFHGPDVATRMEVVESVSDERVVWRCMTRPYFPERLYLSSSAIS